MNAEIDVAARAPFTPEESDAIERAMLERRSVRAFLPTPVPREAIEHILEVAARAPSGTNMQPWRAHVVAGEERDRLVQAVIDAFTSGAAGEHKSEYK